jgi:hypothetical protein
VTRYDTPAWPGGIEPIVRARLSPTATSAVG